MASRFSRRAPARLVLVAVDLFACSIPEVARALRAAHLGALRAARTTVQSERFRGKGDKELPFT